MMSSTMKLEYEVLQNDFTRAGEASSNIKKVLKQLGINSKVIRRVAVASYEAEINLVIHACGGNITMTVSPDEINLNIKDKGPGIENVELAMKEGYSTATEKIRELGFGAGMGLPNIKRCSDEFEISSEPGVGTELSVKIYLS